MRTRQLVTFLAWVMMTSDLSSLLVRASVKNAIEEREMGEKGREREMERRFVRGAWH